MICSVRFSFYVLAGAYVLKRKFSKKKVGPDAENVSEPEEQPEKEGLESDPAPQLCQAPPRNTTLTGHV